MVEIIQTAADLMSLIAAAGASGDITEVIRLGNLLRKQKSDIEKAESEKLQKESEALAGDRQKLAESIHKAVVRIDNLAGKLQAVKATGFTYKVDENGVQYKSVSLTVPVAKTKKAGNGGVRVSTKDELGMSLSELIETYGTSEEKQGCVDAYTKAEKNKGSAKWQEQNKVKAEILKRHPELVRK